MSQISAEWNKIFATCTKPHWDALLRFAMSLTNSRALSDDILQNSLIKAMRAFPKFLENNFSVMQSADAQLALENPQAAHHLKNWLYKIVKNTYLDERAQQKRWNFGQGETFGTLDDFPSEQEFSTSTGQGSETLSQEHLKNQEKEFYRLALDDDWKEKISELSDRQRSLLFLAAEDYSYKEIANLLDIPIGTVMSGLSRALQKLKKP